MRPNRVEGMVAMKLDAKQFRELARFLIHTRPDEISCDEWVARVAGYAESVLAGSPEAPEFACVAAHIKLCPECAEEFKAILDALREE